MLFLTQERFFPYVHDNLDGSILQYGSSLAAVELFIYVFFESVVYLDLDL